MTANFEFILTDRGQGSGAGGQNGDESVGAQARQDQTLGAVRDAEAADLDEAEAVDVDGVAGAAGCGGAGVAVAKP